jgi:hypothetical protein
VRFFRKNDDLRQLVEHQRRRRALSTVVAPAPSPTEASGEERGAPVISLAAARARRAGHPSSGRDAKRPLSAP